MTAYLKIFPAYNKRGAILNTPMPGEAFHPKALRASFTLTVLRYIAPRDTAALGDLPLGQRYAAVETVT